MDLPLPVRIHSHHLLPCPNLEQVGRTGKKGPSCRGIKSKPILLFHSANHHLARVDEPPCLGDRLPWGDSLPHHQGLQVESPQACSGGALEVFVLGKQ